MADVTVADDAARQEAAARALQLTEKLDVDGFFEMCQAAFHSNPHDRTAGLQYCEALGHVGRTDEKLKLAAALIEKWPKDPHLNVCYGLELLAEGRHRDAWKHFAYRGSFKNVIRPDPGLPPERQWRGEPLAGKRIALISEQGLGDTLQFLRYAAHLQNFGARPHLNVQPVLRPLLAQSPALGVVLTPKTPVEIHHWARLIDLLPVLAPTRDDVTWPGAYVAPPASDAPLAFLRGVSGLRVGVAWRGNPAFPSDFARSVPLSALAPLADVDGCRFFSLMPPTAAGEIGEAGADAWLTDLSNVSSPFAELARVIDAMDVVVTMCTSIAHLAGCMGKPTLLMLSRLPDWRWARQGATTPWYPSMRLFRQARFGRWDDVVAEVAKALTAF